VTILTLKSI